LYAYIIIFSKCQKSQYVIKCFYFLRSNSGLEDIYQCSCRCAPAIHNVRAADTLDNNIIAL